MIEKLSRNLNSKESHEFLRNRRNQAVILFALVLLVINFHLLYRQIVGVPISFFGAIQLYASALQDLANLTKLYFSYSFVIAAPVTICALLGCLFIFKGKLTSPPTVITFSYFGMQETRFNDPIFRPPRLSSL